MNSSDFKSWRVGEAWIKRKFIYTMHKLLEMGDVVDLSRILRTMPLRKPSKGLKSNRLTRHKKAAK